MILAESLGVELRTLCLSSGLEAFGSELEKQNRKLKFGTRRRADVMAASSSLDVRALLAQNSASSGRPSIAVDKDDDLTYDLGHLSSFDPSPVDEAALRADAGAYLLRTTRDNAQLLANQLYALLATQPNKSAIRLPAPTTSLPREKPLPQQRPQTRWEKFAQGKGIVKKKRSKMEWDENTQKWAPRFGFGRTKDPADALQTWLIPAKPGEDQKFDPFEERVVARKESKAKQVRQEERNRLEAAHAAGLPSRLKGAKGNGKSLIAGDITAAAKKKQYLAQAIRATQVSTASIGRFDKQMENEPSKGRGKRQQYGSATSATDAGVDKKRAAHVVGNLFPEDHARSQKRAAAVDTGKATKIARMEKEKENRKAKAAKAVKPGGAGKKAKPALGGGTVGKGKATFKVKGKASAKGKKGK